MEVNQVKGGKNSSFGGQHVQRSCGAVLWRLCEAERGALWVEQREPREGGGGPSRRIFAIYSMSHLHFPMTLTEIVLEY